MSTDINKLRREQGWPLNAEHGTVSAPDADGFRREIAFEAGHPWNTKGQPPSKNYGRGALKIRMLLHGPKGSAQFLWSAGVVPEQRKLLTDYGTRQEWEWEHSAPMGFDVGYHADEPQYEGQDVFECAYRPSGQCYYDGSGIAGDDFLEIFLTKGEDALWTALMQRYTDWFGEAR